MYMKLLEQAVRELKGEEPEEEVRAVVNLRVDLRIDDTYVPDMNQRLIVYRRIAAARTERELEEALAEVKDRYGEPPASVLQLVDYGQIRVLADRLGIESIDRDGQVVHFKFRPQTKVDPTRLVALVRARPGLALSPPVTLKLDLRQVVPMPADRDAPPTGPQRIRPKGSKKIPGSGTSSWWTTRATSGTVEPGFSREEILKPQKEDPRGPHGVLTLVGDLLRALAAAHQGH
jgi:transcription-repair coupling factor (superfamily II helicase)